MKTCSKCKQLKEDNLFTKCKNCKTGLDYYCKDCRKRDYISRNYNRKEYNSKYIRVVSEKRKTYLKEYLKNYSPKYRNKNKEKIKNYYVKSSRVLLSDEEKSRLRKLRDNIKRLVKRSISSSDTSLGWTKEQFFAKFVEIPKGYHIDHKIPVSWFCSNTPLNIINNLENLQILPANQNLRKGNRYANFVETWYLDICLSYLKPHYRDLYDNFILKSYPYLSTVSIKYL